MSFWAIDWFNLRKVAELQSDIAKANKSLAELGDKLILCQTEKSKAISESKILEGRLTSALSSNAEMKQEIAALKDSQNSDAGLLKEIAELQATCKRRQGTIDNLQTQRDELQEELSHYSHAKDITPKDLTDYLIAKYPQGTDVSKVWDDWAEAIINAFAVKLLDPIKELSGTEFKDSILNAFPGIKFNSMLMDGTYFCPSCADIVRVIRNDWGNLKPYVPERGDCNWFAERLRVHFNNIYLVNNVALVVGMAPFGLHAWSIIKGSDGIVVCEPQNDMVVIVPESIGYEAQEIIIA